MRPGFSLVFIEKCDDTEITLRRKLVTKKELALDNLGGSWPIQIALDAKIGKFIVMKAFLIARQLFVERD